MIRLNKYIASSGVCTRKEADVLISAGKIKVNQNIINSLGFKVNDEDVVEYNGKVLTNEKLTYVLLNKSKSTSAFNLVKDFCDVELSFLIELNEKVTGVVILTNDKILIDRLANTRAIIKQKYILQLKEPLSEENIQNLKNGVQIDGDRIVFDMVKYGKQLIDKTQLVVLVSFRNQDFIFKAIEQFNNEIIHIDRVEFGGVRKGDLLRGKCRYLEPKEIGFLKMTKV